MRGTGIQKTQEILLFLQLPLLLKPPQKKKKKKATTHALWKYAIQKCLNEEMSKENFYFPSEQKDVICTEQPVAKSVSILSFHREKLYIIFKKSEMNT